MKRIKFLWVFFLPLVALIQGDFTVDLFQNEFPNLVVIFFEGGQSYTCSQRSLAGLVPDDTIRLRKEGDSNSALGPPVVEPVLVALFDRRVGVLCASKRQKISIPEGIREGTQQAIRIFQICEDCNMDDIVVRAHNKTAQIVNYAVDLAVDRVSTWREARGVSLIESNDSSVFVKRDGIEVFPSTIDAISPQETVEDSRTRNLIRLPIFKERGSGESIINSQQLASIGDEVSFSDATSQLQTVNEGLCLVAFDECCTNMHCPMDSICVNRHCIDIGFPRFTLEWIGNDDIDLHVVTPGGAILSYQHVVDQKTGGIVGEPVDQEGTGFHVENIYFPIDSTAPEGVYEYYVKPMTTVGSGDEWTVSVWDEQGEVIRHTGTRFSPRYAYTRKAVADMQKPTTLAPQEQGSAVPSDRPSVSGEAQGSPRPTETIASESSSTSLSSISAATLRNSLPCTPFINECCVDSDCLFAGEVCFNRNCVDDGNPRITLSWIGDDDLDLFVLTPDGVELSFMNFFDPLSGGRFGEDVDQFGTGHHVENVFFPLIDAPFGMYQFFVRPLTTVEQADSWTLTVFDRGQVLVTETGTAESPRFSFLREIPAPAPFIPNQQPSLPPLSRPISSPAEAPSNNDVGCNSFFDECCENTDCPTSRDTCTQQVCIRDGNPRFTLLWDGDDALDLFVLTPDGVEISSGKTFDMFSGGRFESDPIQSTTGMHVESVYFPVLGSPSGKFRYGVRSISTVGAADTWTIEVYEDGVIASSRDGQGTSEEYEYNRLDGTEGPQRPLPSPPRCSPIVDECCLDSDCGNGDICVQRTCISEGSPRISLEWTGDDDLNLVVQTPSGAMLSERNQVDPDTGGRYQSDAPQVDFDFHVESVYFPEERAESGSYAIQVESATTRGVGADVWKIRVFENGVQVQDQSGIGESRQFIYERLQGAPPPTPTAPIPSPTPLPTCTKSEYECCENSHCRGEDICVNRNCISNGSPRISLSWIGDDDYDVYLKTPHGDVIFHNNRFDPTTGGRFDTDPVQRGFGFHIENIVFPASSSPLGDYTAAVRLASRRGLADTWTLQIFDGNRQQVIETGTGDSEFLTYSRKMAVGRPTPSAPTGSPPHGTPVLAPVSERPPSGPSSPSPPSNRICPHECCSDDDCGIPGEICIQRTCIREGTPRFTLTWTGNDDLSLVVVPPGGQSISYLNPNDSQSGGTFGEDGNQDDFGFHVENIFFPTRGGPGGEYEYFVKSTRRRGDSDRWALRVFVNDQLVAWRTGTGASRTFTYDYDSSISPPTSQPILPPFTTTPVATRPPVNPPTTESCQQDSECLESGEICIQEICINDGNPRFTLLWSGNDDLQLYVETPGGETISMLNPFDAVSGGIFGEAGKQIGFDRHVENIFFSLGPPGTYIYYVQSLNSIGTNDFWQATASVNGIEQAIQSGSGDSEKFVFEFDDEGVGPSFPTMAPAPECLSTSDCPVNEVCVNENCVEEGNPRITLSWTGDDELDLYLETPLGVTISSLNPLDPLSSGRFGAGGGDQREFARHTENIYFPGAAPGGKYKFFVDSYIERGSADLWTVEVFTDGQALSTESGMGDSDEFEFDFAGTPGLNPTLPPAGFCDPEIVECCTVRECLGQEVCTQNTCIDDGEPRFTLTWSGSDDLDLVVQTPNGTFISFLNDFDPVSGGRFGDGGDQFEAGDHVENIYFPYEGSPIGVYAYFVRSFLPVDQDDTWTVTVYVEGQVAAQTVGTGNSDELRYDYLGFLPTLPPVSPPTLPPEEAPTPPEDCNFLVEECCTDLQCITGVETCVQTQCVDMGNPRFTLTWTGDDDLDLLVETPLGNTVSFIQPVDEASGGVYGEEGSQFVFDKHVENVYFQEGKAPTGVYKFSVESFVQRSSSDRWTVTVYVDNQEIVSETGFGDSVDFSFNYLGPGSGSQDGGSIQLPVCQDSIDECCDDEDCTGENELCVQRTCIDRGSPRFTLEWTGDDDLDLTVVTPFGSTVAVASPLDPLSGGIFGEEGDQLSFGAHVENVFFPLGGGPAGTYTFFVAAFDEVGTQDEWTVTVFVDDSPALTRSGQGTSDFFVFEYFDGFSIPSAALRSVNGAESVASGSASSVLSCSVGKYECCQDTDCGDSSNFICVQRMCINEGSPRFTLTWNGNDDYEIEVDPPIGSTISLRSAFDFVSGGRFDGEGLKSEPGLHVENIFFPNGGPVGTYRVRVDPFRIIDFSDTWTLSVYDQGVEVYSISGEGAAEEITFEFGTPDAQQDVQKLCDSSRDQCCNDKDCKNPYETCHQRSCVVIEQQEAFLIPEVAEPRAHHDSFLSTKGTACEAASDCAPMSSICLVNTCFEASLLRISIQWHGDDDWGISIWAPDMTNYNSSEDDNNDQWQEIDNGGLHLRSLEVRKPMDGKYLISVDNNSGHASDKGNDWILWIHRDGEEVFRQDGVTSGSSFFGYSYEIP